MRMDLFCLWWHFHCTEKFEAFFQARGDVEGIWKFPLGPERGQKVNWGNTWMCHFQEVVLKSCPCRETLLALCSSATAAVWWDLPCCGAAHKPLGTSPMPKEQRRIRTVCQLRVSTDTRKSFNCGKAHIWKPISLPLILEAELGL